jgi:hypothetical protein
VDTGDGRTSFTFQASPAQAPTVARAAAPMAQATTPVPETPPTEAASEIKPIPLGGGGATIARAASTPGGGSDDAYEAFLDKLKRDLLRERELYGDLLGDLSW